jgi:HEAT repeat protein
MSSERPREPDGATPQAARSGNAKRFQTGVRGLIVVVACGGFMSWAARTLWENEHPAVVAARGLQSSNPSDRETAVRQLLSSGLVDPDQAIPPLVTALGDSEAGVRIAAAEALGAMANGAVRTGRAGDQVRSAVGGLIRSSRDPDPAIRIAVMQALAVVVLAKGSAGVIDPSAVVAAFAATLGDRDERVRRAALDSLRQCGPLGPVNPPAELTAAIEDGSPTSRAAAITALAAFRGALDPWLRMLLQGVEHGEPRIRDACKLALLRSSPPSVTSAAIPSLVAALDSPSRDVRYCAIRALHPHAGAPGAHVAIPRLLAILREPIDLDRVRQGKSHPAIDWDYVYGDPAREAADLLGELAPDTRWDAEVIAALTEAVRSGHPARRGPAVRALGEFGSSAQPAIPAIIRALRLAVTGEDDFGFFYGDSAARVLGQIAPGTKAADEAIEVLIAVVDSHFHPQELLETQLAAIEVLPTFGSNDPRIISRIQTWQKHSDTRVKTAADRAMTALEATGAAKSDGNPR